MKVLLITAMWPTRDNPAFGSFVSSQARCLEEAGVEVEPLVLQGRWRKLIYPLGVIGMHRRLSGPVDLIHAHYGYVGWVGRLQWSVPLVVTYHGDDVLGTIDGRGQTTKASRIAAAACRSLGRFADAVVVQSKQMASRFRHANVHIIPHEVELNIFRPTDRAQARQLLGLNKDGKYMLFAANPDIPVKRFELAKRAYEHVRSEHPGAELVVRYKEPQDRLALYMSACDVLVFPSYQEGSPNVVKQAMACNLPIVATDVGDVREITGGVEGCAICPPDPESFAAAVNVVLRSAYRTDGRRKVESLSGPRVAGRLISVYEDVLRRRTRQLDTSAEKAV